MTIESTDTTDTNRPTAYERTVLTLRVVKLSLGILVSVLTVLRLVGVL
jgi:hypothetical protein